MSVVRTSFVRHEGVAAPLLRDNIDTDQIIPSREMKKVDSSGLGEGLFAGWRYRSPQDRAPNPDFILNKPVYDGATILLSGANFGCGSSREHAVWALREYGFRCVIAVSFGSIFQGNCARNGILPIALKREEIEEIARHVEADPAAHHVNIDLKNERVELTGQSADYSFSVDPYDKRLLLHGADPIDLTLQNKPVIDSYLSEDRQNRPWIYV
ncbi:MAG: 3-isopropylmalate dehydratase small subunit [Parvularculaceae bacterium]